MNLLDRINGASATLGMGPSDLDEKIARLEQRLAELERRPQPDSLQPSLLSIGANGVIGADFTGHIHAQGLDLDAGTNNTPPSIDRVRWLRLSDGAVVADATATNVTAQAQMTLNSYFVAGDNGTEIVLAANPLGTVPALLTVLASGPDVSSEIDLRCGATLAQLLDNTGRSDFLQLAATQRLALAKGSGTLVFTASNGSAVLTVPHSLTRVPTCIVFGVQNFGGVCTPSFQSVGAASFDVVGWAPTAFTGNVQFHWLALG